MKRNPNLSLKKPEHLQKVRKSARKPEIIYDFYEKLASLLKSNDLEGDDKACFIFNADESAFCSDPSRLRAIGEKGEPLNRVSGGSGRENTTVLACVSADGFTLPPLIIFKGAAVQARWTSDEAYPGTLYGASKNGWMEEPQFFYWLSDGFVPHICKLRQNKNMFNQTALLLYDGHASHISVRIVELAMKNNIHLLRLPSHLTDKLQPLDKAVFGPVKTAWDKILVDHGKKMMGVGTGRLKRDQFSKLLGNVWIKAVISKNIIAGFRSTGVFPVNAEMFPEKEFDQHELAKYRKTLSDQSNIPISENDTLVSQSGTSGSSLQPTTSIHPYAGAGSCTAQETFNSGELVLSTDLEATSSTSINEQTVNSQIQDCLHLQLYRDSKDRYKQGQTKASLSLENFLGVETGFTLDKESNTIAIICQDVIVVLAFDTRERLMQWQVKISNHLGDDIQYLVLVSSAPPKSKMQTGPSRMHIQDHRFCLTTGVPPKLAGLWDIAYLRRYGVVDNRFCFEGGSRCGKGEGLYVIVTDQGEEITRTLKLASQAKLSSKKRQLIRKLGTINSTRKLLSPRPLDTEDDDTSCHIEDLPCTCGSRTPYWPSQESRDIDYGCGDTNSVSECHDSFNDGEVFPKNVKANLERCMSCISKLGAPSMSRSSTATSGNATPSTGHPPLWTILAEQSSKSNNTISKTICSGIDRMSICSSHGSSGGYGSSASSEYSVPRMTSIVTTTSYLNSCYESISTQHCCPGNYSNFYNSPQQQNGLPSIKVVSKNISVAKPPMPLPIYNPILSRSPTCITTQPTNIGSYENYDIPKNSFIIDTNNSNIAVMDNYDTPKNIQEYIVGDDNSNRILNDQRSYYDTPAQLGKMYDCIINRNQETSEKHYEGGLTSDCACSRVMSWADNWITLPYCKRGNGVENTGVPMNRVKLSGEGKMPVMKPTGELAIYATVDFSKKSNRKQDKHCDCTASNIDDSSETSSTNYINLDPHVLPETSKNKTNATEDESKAEKFSANYTNLNFAQSLENYENSKELLHRAGITAQEMEELQARELQTFCCKCGHASNKSPEMKAFENVNVAVSTHDPKESQQNEYLKMDTTEKCDANAKFPGYLPMSPAPPNVTAATKETVAPPLPSKNELLKRIIGEKSASNPSLHGPVVDRSRKRVDQTRVPGSAMMILHRTGNNPYNRKQIMDNSDLLLTDKILAIRKRSSSADSSRFLEDAEEFDSSETLRKCSLTQISRRRSSSPCLHQEMETYTDETCFTKTNETEDESSVTSTSQSQNSQSVHIRRSASVPCKAQNRDSSSSNDSGVSTGSLRHRVGDFHEFELPLTTALSARRHQRHVQPLTACIHATLPRRSKSFDPLREISFQFQKVEIPVKSTSAEAEVPLCTKNRDFTIPCEGVLTVGGPPFIDSRSTSSGTSDMSDYIETLSLSSHSSSDAAESIRLLRQATSTLRPRSGKEYQNIDRSLISLTQSGDNMKIHNNTPIQLRGLLSCSTSYANIKPVPENTESLSPGYQSETSPQETNKSFIIKDGHQLKQ